MSEQTSEYDPVPGTAREALERWDKGESVFTIEMGQLAYRYPARRHD